MLTFVFAGLAAFLVLAGLAFEPLLLLIAAPFAVVAYLMWYQSSGRLVERLYTRVERRARVDGEWTPREEWERRGRVGGPGAGAGGRARRGPRTNGTGRRRRQNPSGSTGPTRREASRILGVSPDADEQTVRDAYREKVKATHPDTAEGSEEAFKRVSAAYDRLSE